MTFRGFHEAAFDEVLVYIFFQCTKMSQCTQKYTCVIFATFLVEENIQ